MSEHFCFDLSWLVPIVKRAPTPQFSLPSGFGGFGDFGGYPSFGGGYGRRGYGRSFGNPRFFGRGRRHRGHGLGGLGRVIGPGLIIGGAAFGGALIGAGLAQNGFGK